MQPSASRCLPAEWQCPSKEGWPPDLNLLVSPLPHSGTNRSGQILLGCVRLLDIDVPDDLHHVLTLPRLVLDVPDLAV